MGHWMFGGGFFGWAITLVIIVLVVLVLGRLFKSGGNPSTDTRDSLKILDDRFARGEISEQEYLKMREVLERRNGSG
jgi:putative membrane protein